VGAVRVHVISGAHEMRTRDFEIPGLVLAHHPGMTVVGYFF
jgi:hypothetical protein